jgi:polyisoprenoid-binding protein YceI
VKRYYALVVLAAAALIPPNVTTAQSVAPKAKSAAPSAASWVIDARQSRIGFSTRWAGEAVNGNFRQWAGDIKFDPANLAGSKAVIMIQTGSALTGMKEPDDNLGGSDWLDTRRFPTARYETTAIRSLGGNRYVADGLLTIKGVAYRLALPFNVTIAGNVATMTGQATLDRMTLKLGLESDSSAEWVARETVVNVAVRATRR